MFPIQVGKSFCYFNFKMAFRFLHRKNRNAAKRFGKKGWSLRRGKRTFPEKGFFPSSSNNLYWEQSFIFSNSAEQRMFHDFKPLLQP